MIPKREIENIEWRQQVIADAEDDEGYQNDLMAMCKDSLLLWVNLFSWTYHQMDVEDGERVISRYADVPFIPWEVQDDAFDRLLKCLSMLDPDNPSRRAEDILFDKSRDIVTWVRVGSA
jgi:hypothetical protein